MKTICIALPSLICGGTERTAAILANYFASRQYKVTLLLLFKKTFFYHLDPRIELVTPKLRRETTNKYLYLIYLVFYIRKSMKLIKPEKLFILGYISLFLISLRMSKRRYNIIISNRTSPLRSLFPFYQPIRNMLYKTADKIIVQTEYTARIYREQIKPKNIIVIPNFLRKVVKRNVTKENIIVTVGRLVPEKNHKELINAFGKSDFKDWKLVIVGGGYLEKDLKQLTANLGLEKNVIFTGFSNDVDLWLSKAKIFVLTSLTEGYPNALIEAMSLSLPCISYDCIAGPSEIIKQNINGILIAVGDVDLLTESLNKLMSDVKLRSSLGKNAHEINETNSFEKIALKYEEFIFS